MIRRSRWAKAVASAGTRAMAPPSDPQLGDAHGRVRGLQVLEDGRRPPCVDRVDEQRAGRPRSGGTPVLVRRVHLRVAAWAGPCRRAAWPAPGTARAPRSPASAVAGVAASMAMMTSWPWCSAGTNGIGGAGMTLAMVDSSSGAASAAAMKPGDGLGAWPAAAACRPTTPGSSCSRNWNRVATPKLPPPPRMAQNRSGCVSASDAHDLAVGGDDARPRAGRRWSGRACGPGSRRRRRG